jgi:prevent-host-death family protein
VKFGPPLAHHPITIRASRSSSNNSRGVRWFVVENTVTSTEAKNKLNRILADIERTGESVTITNHGRPVAMLVPVQPVPRTFGQLPNLMVPKDFDDALPDVELDAWERVDQP